MGGTFDDAGSSLTVGSNGLVYITGYFTNVADFDPGSGASTLTSEGGTDIFVSILYDNGNFFYAWRMGGTGQDQGLSIALGNDDSLAATGYFSGTADFADPYGVTNTLVSAGGTDIFIYKLDANWNMAWLKQIGGSGSDQGSSLALGSDGSVVTTGYFSNVVVFDPGSGTCNLTSKGGSDAFVLKLDTAGNFLWARQMGGSAVDRGQSLALAGDGSVITTGYFNGTAVFDAGSAFSLTSAGKSDIFVSKLDATGKFLWARRMGSTDVDQGLALALAGDGSVLATGSFSGTVDFDPGDGTFNLTIAGGTDLFISKLDSAGNFTGAWRIGGVSQDYGDSLACGDQGSVFITGVFSGIVDFNLGPQQSYLTSAGSSDMFLAQFFLNPPTNIQLSSASVQENQPVGSLVGLFAATDPDADDAFTYSLVSGAGDADNGSFYIDGNQLKTNAIFDYETKSTYNIRVRTSDYGGQAFEKTFTIMIVPPTLIWNGGGGDNNWSTAANWSGGAAPLSGDNLVFPAGAKQLENVNDYTNAKFGAITVSGSGYRLLTGGLASSGMEVQPGAQVDVDAIITGTLTIGAGATLTIAAIPGGPLSDAGIQDTLVLEDVHVSPANVQIIPDTTAAQEAVINSDATDSPTGAETVAVPSYAEIAVFRSLSTRLIKTTMATPNAAPFAEPIETPAAMPISASGNSAAACISADTIYNTIIKLTDAHATDVTAAPPALFIADSIPSRQFDFAIKNNLPQSPTFSRIASPALPGTIKNWLINPLALNQINEEKTTVFAPLHNESPLGASLTEKHAYSPAIIHRLAHHTALKAITENLNFNGDNVEMDFDASRHVRNGKRGGQLEKAIDAVIAGDEDLFLRVQ